MTSEIISVKDLHFKYQTSEVLADIEFGVKTGDFVGGSSARTAAARPLWSG